MKITDVKVFPVDEEKLKAYATITFENCFIVRDLKVISGNKGYFIAMPSKKRKDGTFRDVAHPLNSETRKMIEDAVLEVYEKEASVPKAEPSSDHEEKEASTPEAESSSGNEEKEPSVPEAESSSGNEEKEPSVPEAESSSGNEEKEPSTPEAESSSGNEEKEPSIAEVGPSSDYEFTAGQEPEVNEQAETAEADTGETPGTDETESEQKLPSESDPDITPSKDPEKAFGYEE